MNRYLVGMCNRVRCRRAVGVRMVLPSLSYRSLVYCLLMESVLLCLL